jgi:hypothetical protein
MLSLRGVFALGARHLCVVGAGRAASEARAGPNRRPQYVPRPGPEEGLWEPAAPGETYADPAAYEAALARVLEGLSTSWLPTSPRCYVGWVGVEAPNEEDAVWLLRAVLVGRVLARREEKVLFLPVEAAPDADQAARIIWTFNRAWELRQASWPRRSSRR